MKTMKLCSFTHLGFLLNWIIDECPDTDLSFKEIHDAAREGDLVGLLAKRYGHVADFGLLEPSPGLEQMEAALRDAASGLEGREGGKLCVTQSGLCLAMAIVLEAIQQQFHLSDPPLIEPEEDAALLPPWTPEG